MLVNLEGHVLLEESPATAPQRELSPSTWLAAAAVMDSSSERQFQTAEVMFIVYAP